MERNFHRSFPHCPTCGSPNQFFNQLGQELKDRKLARKEWNMRYTSLQGVVQDDNKQVFMPVGISLPGYLIQTDICMECGTVYATELFRIEGRTQAGPLPGGLVSGK